MGREKLTGRDDESGPIGAAALEIGNCDSSPDFDTSRDKKKKEEDYIEKILAKLDAAPIVTKKDKEKLFKHEEAEERKKEEERELLEELRRVEEEDERRRLKERFLVCLKKEKEKLLRTKQQEKLLLTAKQSEEVRMRRQFLANEGGLQLPSGEPFKRPLYQKKRPNTSLAQSNGASTSDDHPVQKEPRSPVCCILGHVETGKTKLIDFVGGTNVQEGEAGGITQHVGATYFRADNIRERTKELKADAKLNVPGLLIIDTPGHESFTSLRSRGLGLCDVAILVVDIMHGLEPQTIESLNLLKMRNTDFIVALNKVDRLSGWKTCHSAPIAEAVKQQSEQVQMLFNDKLTQIITQFKEQGLNTEVYYKNRDNGKTINIVPTSAISGEGIPDLLLLLVQWTQKTRIERLTFSNEVQCTVLEVEVVEGHGTTIDVVLVNGVLHEGDQIVVCRLEGPPIVTTIRALLTHHPMKQLRAEGTYLHHKVVKAAQGIKIIAQGLEHAVAGTRVYVVGPHDDLEDVENTAMEDMKSVMSRIDISAEGVYVQASSLGSLEALLDFLKICGNTPVSGISIGPVRKKDVLKASVMLAKKRQYATILAFDVKVTQEARELADELGVTIFIDDIIYHLFDKYVSSILM